MRKVLFPILVSLLAVSLAGIEEAGGRPEEPRYIILICIDALRPDHLGCYGYNRETSPDIDGLAAEGVVFENAVSQAPWTLPSLTTILSSTFPCQHEAEKRAGGQSPLNPRLQTFAEVLASNGYRTCAMSPTKIFTRKLGLGRVFEEAYCVAEGENVFESVTSAELTDAAIEWMRGNLDRGFLLFLHHYDTHHPYKAERSCWTRFDPDYSGRYTDHFGDSTLTILRKAHEGRLAEVGIFSPEDMIHIQALYDCEIIRTDRTVGRLVDSLAAWGGLERSLIVIFADHGEEFFEHGSVDHGQTVFEESIRVPLIVYAPSLLEEPARIRQQVGLIDIGPTILEGLDIEIPPHFEGRSFLPFMMGRPGEVLSGRRPCGLPYSCLVAEGIARRTEVKGLRCPPWKLILDPFLGSRELYNIDHDPHEARNLADAEPAVTGELTETLLTAMGSYYPGGWCVAWRSGGAGETIAGTVRVKGTVVEALKHHSYPYEQAAGDTLIVGKDRGAVSFKSGMAKNWEGIEVRLASGAEATFDLSIDGQKEMDVRIGEKTAGSSFPITLKPSSARVERQDLHRLLSDPNTRLAIYWIEPGAAPLAKEGKEDKLRKQLKSIGYIGN